MKIAWLTPGGFDRSGAQRVIPVLLWLAEQMTQRHQLHVFELFQYPEPGSFTLVGARVHNLARPRQSWLPVVGFGLTWRRLAAGLRKFGPFDVIHAFWGGQPGLLAGFSGLLGHTPVVLSLMGGELVSLPEIGYGAQRTWRARLQVAWSVKLARRVTVASGYMAGLAEAKGLSVSRIPLGVPSGLVAAQRTMTGRPPWRLLHVGSLNRVKDGLTLLRAFARVAAEEPETRLDVVGQDTLDGALQRLCAGLGLSEAVTFHGFLPQEALRPLYRQADLLALPSRHDAAPVVMLEAAACGLPTIGTAVGYAVDWHPDHAWAVPVGDVEALAEGMLSLLRDGDRRARMGRAAQAWVMAHDAGWSARQFEALYQAVQG